MKKGAGLNSIQPEHTKYDGGMLDLYLSIASTLIRRQSFVAQQFLSSFIVPIIKDRCGDITDVNNYRGVTICLLISKVIDLVLLDRMERWLVTKKQQFGFKHKQSRANCSFVPKSAIEYYLKRGNDKVFLCVLVISKA